MAPPRIRCPTCQRPLDWQHAPCRPFCSERCRLIDLGAWLSEQRSIPGDPAQSPEPARGPEDSPGLPDP
ncbi:MAG: DNA gyrase inhibitor YacG [Gammaproteobacteria bacterium]|nr:DNA gyrase inhibitor YacG [Gammaproteobacteria bacterium]